MCYACTCSVPDLGMKETSYCDTFQEDRTAAVRWGLLATFIVIVTNQVLKQTIVKTTSFAKSHTQEEELQSKVMRIFLVQFTNTAVLVLITKSTLGPFDKIPGEHFDSMNAKWYASVAAPMMMTMIIQLVTPSVMHLVMWGIGGLLKMKKKGGALTQNQLNAVCRPKSRDFAAGYGEILLAMSVTLIYGPAVPVLYFVAAAGFMLRYAVERFADLRIYKNPPLYSKELVGSFDSVLCVVMLLHTGFSVALITVAGGLQPAATMPFNPTNPHCIPMLITFIICCILFCYKFIVLIVPGNNARDFLYASPGGRFCIFKGSNKSEDLKPFSEVYRAGELANEDDDYYMDELEALRKLQDVFMKALVRFYVDFQCFRLTLDCFATVLRLFCDFFATDLGIFDAQDANESEDPELMQRCKAAVESCVGKKSDELDNNGVADNLEEGTPPEAAP